MNRVAEINPAYGNVLINMTAARNEKVRIKITILKTVIILGAFII